MPVPGDFVLVQYASTGRPIYHSRLVVAVDPVVGNKTCYVLTPDDEEFVEDLEMPSGDPDILRVVVLSHHCSYPADISARRVHEFQALPDRTRRVQLAANACSQLGLPITAEALDWEPRIYDPGTAQPTTPPHGGAAGPDHVAGAGGGGGLSGLAAALAAPTVGEQRQTPRGDTSRPLHAAADSAKVGRADHHDTYLQSGRRATSIPATDVRVLDISYDPLGSRFKDYREAVNACTEHEWTDWPIKGPRTTLWLLRFFLEIGGNPISWFTKFKSDGKLDFTDEGIEELERLCRQLHTMVCYDQLNVPDIAGVELLCRSIQVTAYGYRERFTTQREDSYERGLMFGVQFGEGNLPICPALKDYMAAELQKKNAIDKERRKAIELRIDHPNQQPRGRGRQRGRGTGRGGGADGEG